MADEIEQKKQEGIETVEVSDEDMFLAQMKEESTLISIWKIGSIHELGKKYRNIDTYLNMKKDTELQQGKLNNLDQIKGIIEQMLTKEIQGGN